MKREEISKEERKENFVLTLAVFLLAISAQVSLMIIALAMLVVK